MTIRIQTGFSGTDYLVSHVDGGTATESVKSRAELRNVLKLMGTPPELIEPTVVRLNHERLVDVIFEPRSR